MFSITIRRRGCLSAVSINGITVIEPGLPDTMSSSCGCAEYILPGRNRLAVVAWVPDRGVGIGGVGSFELELDRFARSSSGIQTTKMITLSQSSISGSEIISEGEFAVEDAPLLSLFSADKVNFFGPAEAEQTYQLAKDFAAAMESGRHENAERLASKKFDDMALSLQLPREKMIEIFKQGFQRQGPMSSVPFSLGDMRAVAEAENRLFVLKKSGGLPLLSFSTPGGIRHVQIGVSRFGGRWMISS